MANTENTSESNPPGRGPLPIQADDQALKMFRHDLMTPINLILGYSEMLEEDFEEEGNSKATADLQKIRTAAQKLMALIEENTRAPETGYTPAPAPRPAPSTAPPAGTDTPASPSHPKVAGPESAGRCLVVDDTENNRDLLTRLLAKEGFSSSTANNGREALERLQKEPFDLVLLDVMMPEMDGHELLTLLKADPHLRHVPVIMVSAFSDLERTADCIKLGAEDYLPKPFNSTLLLARVTSCLEKKRMRDKEQQMYRDLQESQEALATELKEAAAHVKNLLPQPLKSAPVRTDWRFIPSTHLGGDAFGYFHLPNDYFALFLLDVCGHGVKAALLSITVMNVLRAHALPNVDFLDPGSVLEALNNHFQMSEHRNMYFTIWYGVYEKKTRRLAYASGGHPPAILVHKGAKEVDWVKRLSSGGPIIGMFLDTPYKCAETVVPEGSRLFLFSDGTYEITRPDGEMLTFDEFVDVLAQPTDEPQKELDRIMEFAVDAQQNASFEDDFSIVQVDF